VVSPWLETTGVALVAVLGVFLGRWCSRLRGPYWLVGYFLAWMCIVVLIAARFNSALDVVPSVSWMAAGRVRFLLLAFAITMGLRTPLSRLARRWEHVLICVLMTAFVLWSCVLPVLVPAFLEAKLSNLKTMRDSAGICLQTTGYTCVPAAAVTALETLGLSAEEGEIAILAGSNPVGGTLPRCLSRALQRRYGEEGLKCEYRRFSSVRQLSNGAVTLAVVRDSLLSDHCVAVLDVSDETVTIADPATGMESLSHKQFERVWRFAGIVLERDAAQGI